MIYYSSDENLQAVRSTILNFYPTGITSWDDKHKEASIIIERDLERLWYREKSAFYGYDYTETPFDYDLLLNSGFHFQSDATTAVSIGQRVYVLSSHVAGGETKNCYRKITADLPSTDLSTVDFSDTTAWTQFDNQLKDLGVYQCLALIYRFIANDTAESDPFERERDYFFDQYNKEFQRVLDQGIWYDWDESGSIESDEKIPIGSVKKTKVVW